ncbi:hypothetical protein GCM10007036_07960 [Alsobacter metallidurans]|uniref:Small-conductance mechanosensitive channel n=1 Tax=Alsobacter metallidurans TaxID=340221 RepID=A0A917I478_9HYPH|nr:hypothetical protein GCM10007036_07960 [Alsobacter metallidurans]
MESVLRLIRSLLIGLGLLVGADAWAQQPPGLPQGFTQEQFDGLVDAIGRAVVKKIKEEPDLARPAPKTSGAAPPAERDEDVAGATALKEFLDRTLLTLRALPDLGIALRKLPAVLDRSAEDGRGFVGFLGVVAAAIALSLAAERIVGALMAPVRRRLGRPATPEGGPGPLGRLLGLAVLDGLGVVATWLTITLLSGLWFSGSSGQARLGAAVLSAVLFWRLYMIAFRIVLRPDEANARLAVMSDRNARLAFARVSAIIALVLLARLVIRIAAVLNASPEAVAAGQVVGSIALLGAFLWACVASRAAVAAWFTTLFGKGPIGRVLGQNWLVLAIPFFCALIGARVFGAVSGRAAVPAAMLFTLNAVLAAIFFQTLLRAIEDRTGPKAAPLIGLATRCASTGTLIVVSLLIAQVWIVDVLEMVDAGGWRALARSSATAGVTLFLAYVGFELVRFFTERHAATPLAGGPAEEDEHGAPASRLATMMPLLRTALLIFIGAIATLVVLSEWGVNIAPLIAGASIFGLALSFGSQTLVRDIVSGVFYLADDAFRVGEYIDCGKAKGTVEGFTLRSIRLRHQNGQVHTIPFGQLGQITNFSRDWTTVKFNLRFARDTDVEKLRKAVKRIGQEMLDDPEMKAEFLAPLKMQGIADVAENALIVRFKFTVRPGKPSYIQREAVKRIVRVCREVGIEFASSLVSVQTYGASADHALAGAAAQEALHRAAGELLAEAK